VVLGLSSVPVPPTQRGGSPPSTRRHVLAAVSSLPPTHRHPLAAVCSLATHSAPPTCRCLLATVHSPPPTRRHLFAAIYSPPFRTSAHRIFYCGRHPGSLLLVSTPALCAGAVSRPFGAHTLRRPTTCIELINNLLH